jgi:hypothetical protein
MALKRKNKQVAPVKNVAPAAPLLIEAPAVAQVEAQGPIEPPIPVIILREKYRDRYEPNTRQLFPFNVPTVVETYTEWLKCQVKAGVMERVQ